VVPNLLIVGFDRAVFVRGDLLIDARIQVNRAGGGLLVRPFPSLQPQVDPLQVLDVANVELMRRIQGSFPEDYSFWCAAIRNGSRREISLVVNASESTRMP
jgi:hypothetical protein